MLTNEPDLILVDLRLQGNDSGSNTLTAVKPIHPNTNRQHPPEQAT